MGFEGDQHVGHSAPGNG